MSDPREQAAERASHQQEPAAPGHECRHCGTPLQEGQQWCLNCGACEPGSLGERPSWRPLTVLALTAAILAAGAAVAVAAAIKERNAAPAGKTLALTPAATTPSTAVPPAAAPSTTPTTGGATSTPGTTPKKGSNLLFPPASGAKPPKVTAPAPTPKASGGSGSSGESGAGGEESGAGETGSKTTPAAKSKTTETGSSTTTSGSEGSGKGAQPTPILLDTNAASTYNPYNYPESGFGDPALAIDGEPSTAWTAQVQAHSFPNMAEGLLIDMREANRLGSVELRTPTKGLVVQVYGANGSKAPSTITEPGWALLSGSHTLKKTLTHVKLRTEGRTYRWLLVWLVKAPASAQGTPTAPGRVALSEVALYPPAA